MRTSCLTELSERILPIRQFSHLPFRTEVLLIFHKTAVTQLMADLLLKYDFFLMDVILTSFFNLKQYCLRLQTVLIIHSNALFMYCYSNAVLFNVALRWKIRARGKQGLENVIRK